jgi:ribosome-associated translation inhibitor RaiA
MRVVKASPIVTAIIDGPVSALDRAYAFDELRKLSYRAARQVYRARIRLFWEQTTQQRPVAIADCVLFVEDGKVIVAGAVADTPREAVDELMARLRHRFPKTASRDHKRSGEDSTTVRITA